MTYVQLTNEALEAGFKVIGVDGYERTGKTQITIDGIDVYNGGIVVRDKNNDVKIYMDGQTGNIVFSGDLYGAGGTFSGALKLQAVHSRVENLLLQQVNLKAKLRQQKVI